MGPLLITLTTATSLLESCYECSTFIWSLQQWKPLGIKILHITANIIHSIYAKSVMKHYKDIITNEIYIYIMSRHSLQNNNLK